LMIRSTERIRCATQLKHHSSNEAWLINNSSYDHFAVDDKAKRKAPCERELYL
jgi:hypothetical protein